MQQFKFRLINRNGDINKGACQGQGRAAIHARAGLGEGGAVHENNDD